MLVRIIDHKGRPRHINAMYVKTLTPKGDAQTDIEVSGSTLKIRVDMTPDAVAELFNAAMPTGMQPVLADLENQQRRAEQAAV